MLRIRDKPLDKVWTVVALGKHVSVPIASFGKDRIRISFSDSAIFMLYFLVVNGKEKVSLRREMLS